MVASTPWSTANGDRTKPRGQLTAHPLWESLSMCIGSGLLAARVGVVVHFLQAGLRHVGVDLGGRQALVAEELLDDAQVGASLDEVGGEGVAQSVGVHVAVLDALIEDASHVARPEATALDD